MCLLYGCVCSGARVYQSVMKVGATYMDGQAGCNILCMIKLDYVDLRRYKSVCGKSAVLLLR